MILNLSISRGTLLRMINPFVLKQYKDFSIFTDISLKNLNIPILKKTQKFNMHLF